MPGMICNVRKRLRRRSDKAVRIQLSSGTRRVGMKGTAKEAQSGCCLSSCWCPFGGVGRPLGVTRGESVTKEGLIMIPDRFSPEFVKTLPLGTKVVIDIEMKPVIPSQIRAMEEINMRQHATDAWTACLL